MLETKLTMTELDFIIDFMDLRKEGSYVTVMTVLAKLNDMRDELKLAEEKKEAINEALKIQQTALNEEINFWQTTLDKLKAWAEKGKIVIVENKKFVNSKENYWQMPREMDNEEIETITFTMDYRPLCLYNRKFFAGCSKYCLVCRALGGECGTDILDCYSYCAMAQTNEEIIAAVTNMIKVLTTINNAMFEEKK